MRSIQVNILIRLALDLVPLLPLLVLALRVLLQLALALRFLQPEFEPELSLVFPARRWLDLVAVV